MVKERMKEVKSGDILVVIGSVGQAGAKALLAAKREVFSARFSPEYREQILSARDKRLSALTLFDAKQGAAEELFGMKAEKFGITGVQAVGEGGILRAVWELSGEYGVGVSFSLRRIPIRQWVIEVCECCKANPYRLWCRDCFLVAAQRGWQLAEGLKELGVEAEAIGEVNDGIARKICHGEDVGYLERPGEDEVYRLLGRETAKQIMEDFLEGEKLLQ